MSSPRFTTRQHEMFQRGTVGERVRHLLEVRDITQVGLAPKIGISQAAISNIVTDSSRKPCAATLLAMSEYLACNPGWILTGEGEPFGWVPATGEDQVELLHIYRALTTAQKSAVLAFARSAQQADKT